MRRLSDSYILKWNKRIKDSGLFLSPFYSNNDICISISNSLNTNFGYRDIDQQNNINLNKKIKFNFTFSILKSKEKDFFYILNKLKKEKKPIYFANKSLESRHLFEIQDISYDSIDKDITEHKIAGNEFITYNFKFKNDLLSIFSYVYDLEDSIEFFNQMWGYNSDGTSRLITYQIGDIVSKKNKKSLDFLIFDYHFHKDADYRIDYKIAEMNGDENTHVITYGDIEVVKQEDLCRSRNNTIDGILN